MPSWVKVILVPSH